MYYDKQTDMLYDNEFAMEGIFGKLKDKMSNNLNSKLRIISDLEYSKGCTSSQISEAEKELGIKFSNEYCNYVKEFGAVSFYSTEWTGLNVTGHINVVNVTKKEREICDSFPRDYFVLESIGDGSSIIVNSSGKVFIFDHNNKKTNPVCENISKYLDRCLEKEKD